MYRMARVSFEMFVFTNERSALCRIERTVSCVLL